MGKKMGMGRLFGAIFGLVLLAVGFFWGKSQGDVTPKPSTNASTKSEQATTQKDEPVMAVEAIVPTLEGIEDKISASGVVVGKNIAQVGAKASGFAITDVLVDVGDVVQAGQVLARLDDSTVRQSFEMAKAELTQALATQAKAQADLARVEPLIKIDAISREQYDAYVTAKVQADASVQAVNARLNNTQIQAQNTQIIAPVSGFISAKTAQVGLVATGAPLFDIVQDGVLEWQASLPPDKAGVLAIGQEASVNVGQERVRAVVEKIAPVANNSRELTVHATLAPSPLVRSGMYQSGQFVISSQTLPTLPARVVTMTDGFNYIWTLKKHKDDLYTAHREPIEIAGRTGDKVAVLLKTDTLVVKEGGNFLSEGNLVRVVNLATLASQ